MLPVSSVQGGKPAADYLTQLSSFDYQNSWLLQIKSAAPPTRFVNIAAGIFEKGDPVQGIEPWFPA